MRPLAFISPTASASDVPAESPFNVALAEVEASFEIRDGWRTAVRIGTRADEARALSETVAWSDASHLGKLDVQAAPDRASALAKLAGGLVMGLAVRRRDAWWCQVTPQRAMVLCEPADTAALAAELEDTDGINAVDITGQLSALRISGPLSRQLFARFCALDLRVARTPVGAFLPGSVARTPGYVLREQDNQYLVLLGAAHALSHWEIIADAGRRLGGHPVGVDATQPPPTRKESKTRA
jgi:heterotetrameric sarcosine oxidase gamma subunit